MRVTVDASVAVKWFVAEEGRREALKLTGARIDRRAPDLMLPECANVIWKKSRSGEIRSAQPFIDQIARLSEAVAFHPGAELVRDAAEIALKAGHSVYDCFYIACARLTDSILVTADRRLAEMVSRWVPSVTAITLGDRSEMARIEAAGVRLIISPETVTELIEAWDRFAATWDSVLEDIFSAESAESTEGLRIVKPEHRNLVENLVVTSPTYRKLFQMIQNLDHDERVDLLVLGWSGRGEQMTRGALLDHALRMVDQLDISYIAYLGADWRAGHARLAG
ncbi:type II toxin-antitoxin system VapC family toxin [Candidatus Palauibacter sp.]|uniref:type II toxin-antitoxin system VapC family toxin n=1 Tax=Candidatus Palauibacter sp. TaxID=3101350 RepID=UPI003B525F95